MASASEAKLVVTVTAPSPVMVTPSPMDVRTSVRLMASASPAPTATAPPPMVAAAEMARVLPFVETVMVGTFEMFALPPMEAAALPWKYTAPAETLTPTTPPPAATVTARTVP